MDRTKWWKDNNLYINSDFVKYRVSKIKNIIKKSGMFINYSIIEKDITDTDFRVINLDNNNKKYICEWYLSLTNDFKYNNDIYILNFGFNQNIPNPKLKKTEDSIITTVCIEKFKDYSGENILRIVLQNNNNIYKIVGLCISNDINKRMDIIELNARREKKENCTFMIN